MMSSIIAFMLIIHLNEGILISPPIIGSTSTNCPANCLSFFDGCNDCVCNDNGLSIKRCTTRNCLPIQYSKSFCYECKPGYYVKDNECIPEQITVDKCAAMRCRNGYRCIDGKCEVSVTIENDKCPANCESYITRCSSKNCTTGDVLFYPCAPPPTLDPNYVEPPPYCLCKEGFKWNEMNKLCELETNDETNSICNECESYSDGCNTCTCGSNGLTLCTLRSCPVTTVPYCLTCNNGTNCDTTPTCELGCQIWDDGCNECFCDDNSKQVQCSSRLCTTQREPVCLKCKDNQDCSDNIVRLDMLSKLDDSIKTWNKMKNINGNSYTFIQRNIRFSQRCFTQDMIINVQNDSINYVRFVDTDALSKFCNNDISLFNSALDSRFYKTMDQILTELKDNIKKYDKISVKYNTRGYVEEISSDPIILAIDDEFTTEISCLSFPNDMDQCEVKNQITCDIPGQIYHNCVYACDQRTCNGAVSACNPNDVCKPGCQCPESKRFLDKTSNACVSQCPSTEPIPLLPDPPIKEPPSVLCPKNQVYNDCQKRVCEATCDNPFPLKCVQDTCNPGCICIEGMVNHNGKCILPEECPRKCMPGCNVYFDGCNECRCDNGYINGCSKRHCGSNSDSFCIECDGKNNECIKSNEDRKQTQLNRLKKYYGLFKDNVLYGNREYQFTQKKSYKDYECYLQNMVIIVKNNKVVNVNWANKNSVPKYCQTPDITSYMFNISNYKTMTDIMRDLMSDILKYEYMDIQYNIGRGYPNQIKLGASTFSTNNEITINFDCLSFRNDILQCNGDLSTVCLSGKVYDYCNYGCNGTLKCGDNTSKCVNNIACKPDCICPESKPYWNDIYQKCVSTESCKTGNDNCFCDINSNIWMTARNRFNYFGYIRKCKNKNMAYCISQKHCKWNCNQNIINTFI